MADEPKKTRIAAVADVHFKDTDKGRWTDYLREVSKQAEVFLVCGDITNTGDEEEAKVFSNELKSCTIPVIVVLGNHDYEKGRHKLIRHIIQNDRVHVLDGESVIINDVGFAGIKGFGGGFDKHMLSMFGEEAMKNFVREAVNEALNLDRALVRLHEEDLEMKKVVVMHYSPIAATVAGEPESVYPFLGCSRLAEPLIRHKVIATFHGHAHRGMLEGEIPGGPKVFNVAMPVLQRLGYTVPFYKFEI